MKLIAQTPILHDGETIAIGVSFDVKNDKQAKALIASGAAIDPKAPKPEADAASTEVQAAKDSALA